jgi:cbb3-type cytochrome oxidase maturation protein
MSMIYVLIPLAIVLLALAVWALFWAIRSGQFDDLDSQAWSVVLDDDSKPPGDMAGDEPGSSKKSAPEDTDDEST